MVIGRTLRGLRVLLAGTYWLPLVAGGLVVGATSSAVAADTSEDNIGQPIAAESFAVHGQATYTVQATDGFEAPYSGHNSLSPSANEETVDATLFLGAHLWRGAEAWIEPEIDQGFGLDNTLGVAGFPSGEAYKVGAYQPYFRVPRAFVRQTINEGSEREPVEGIEIGRAHV